MAEGGKWLIDQRALCDHQGSVEDLGLFILLKILLNKIKFLHILVWSPTDESMLLSCSSDRSM